MTAMRSVLDPKILAATRGLTLAARQLVAGLLPGLHASRQPGLAREFAQYRAYQPGDEPRHIDWKLYARSDRYFVRESEIETAVTVRLILDATGSMRHSDRKSPTTKFERARTVAAALALLAQAQGDPVRLHAVTDGGIVSAPHGQTREPTEGLIRTLASLSPAGNWPADGARALRRAMASGGGQAAEEAREIVLVLSDLHEHGAEIQTALAPLRARRHELIVLHLVGRDELEFSYHGLVRFEDWETGAIIEADADAARAAWTAGQEARVQAWRRAWEGGGRFDYVRFCLDDPPERVLRRYLRQRMGRR
jgi:uncharacterized protein (DUF58 family)